MLAAILEELYFSRGKKDYAEIVETLSLHYGSMQTMNQHLVDYITFRNLMRHEYIYHGLEDDIAVYQEMMKLMQLILCLEQDLQQLSQRPEELSSRVAFL